MKNILSFKSVLASISRSLWSAMFALFLSHVAAEAADSAKKKDTELSPEALVARGFAFHDGIGVGKDVVRAAKLWRMAAEKGNRQAQLAFGIANLTGDGVGKNISESLHWFREASKQDESHATYLLGFLLINLIGYETNAGEGVAMMHLAAEQGSMQAQYWL